MKDSAKERKIRQRRAALAKAEASEAEQVGKSVDSKKKKSKVLGPILGSKYVKSLEKVVRQLRDEENAHGNRKLYLDDVFIVYLLAFFNPIVRSLRTIEDLSMTANAQKHLSVKVVCKSTLSDFNKLVDHTQLTPIIEGLRAHIDGMCQSGNAQQKELEGLLQQVVAVDGTFLPAMADVVWAVANKNNHNATCYRARVDARIDVHTWLPEMIVVPEPGQSESQSAAKHIQANKIYVYDRGYPSYELLRAHYEDVSDGKSLSAKAHFVMRYRKEGSNSPALAEKTECDITDDQRKLGIVSDCTGYIQTECAHEAHIDKTLLREVVIKYQDKNEEKTLRIITNLLDVSAETIALIYRSRWQVELFFRWLKSIANFNHLISHTKQGTLVQLYVAIIGVMVMYLHNAYRPSKYTLALLGQVAMGAATLEEILPILKERERRNALARASRARRLAKKKA